MKNPFSPDAFNVQELKRIPRDLSHRKLFTTEFGKGLPVLCQEVFPGDTIKIENVDLSIQGMPTYFPLTSRLKVSVSYFLCRNRCVDDTWEDFIFNTKEIDKAWLRLDVDRAKKMISTGSLGDFLGLPSTYASDTPIRFRFSFSNPSAFFLGQRGNTVRPEFTSFVQSADGRSFESMKTVISISGNSASIFAQCAALVLSSEPLSTYPIDGVFNFAVNPGVSFDYNSLSFGVIDSEGVFRHVNSEFVLSSRRVLEIYTTQTSDYTNFKPVLLVGTNTFVSGSFMISSDIVEDSFRDVNRANIIAFGSASDARETQWYYSETSGIVDSTDELVIDKNIFVGADPIRKVEAHAFRHYTMIGNYYYRNDRNNPYVLNGEVQYNQFIPSKASGPDDNVYDFFYRNWELDRFTSCCQTPQFGDAPLVGLTYNPSLESTQLTFSATDPEGVSREYTVTVGLDSDQKLANIANFDKDIPSAVLQKVTQMITYGTSINDIRVTNSFQRFLERAQRGLRYRHQLKSHLGVSVDYPDIDIPQYIGGFNGEINSFRNENTAASEYANLGDFNGSLFGNFNLPNPITVQVPEHGYIMGIMTIVPVPMYPQSVTNKALLKRSPFEYPLQEFMKVGNVPVHYDEVMPLQNGDGQSPDDVFGYQRPWYEYLSNLDEVHGDFRTTLTQFNCVRMFAQRPELSADFTTVHPEDLNQIFISNNIADKYGSNAKFLCKIDYKMTALRQIPDGDPALE